MDRSRERNLKEQHKEESIDTVNGQELGQKKQTRTVERCFKQKDSNPPVCGVHKVRLVERQLPSEMATEGYQAFRFFVCPVSATVLSDKATGR